MNTGLFIALLGAACWAINSVLARRLSVRTGESFTITAASVFFGVPFFAIVLTITGEWGLFKTVSFVSLVILAASGIIQLLAGRWMNYYAVQHLGANKAGTLVATTPVYSVIFAVLFLDEPLGLFLVIGVVFIMMGVILITGEKAVAGPEQGNSVGNTRLKALLAALGAGFLYGTTSVASKYAVTDIGSPYISVFIFFAAAAVATSFLYIKPRRRQYFSTLWSDAIRYTLIACALLSALSQLFIYKAFSLSPASRVIPLYSTYVLFVFLISLLFNRKLEMFTWKIALGMLAVVLGAFFIFQ